jgi:16S rRNA (guanine966-N2)-methyltransferase
MTPANGRLRVTGGQLCGRRFRVPPGDVRPTSDRVREAVFARLGGLEGETVLDLYAGSGALGIEAISRGATRVVFVEKVGRIVAVLRENLASLELEDLSRVVKGDVPDVVQRLGRASERFNLVFLDPPYAANESGRALEALVKAKLLSPEAMVVLECDRRHPSPEVDGLTLFDERRYGDTIVVRLVGKKSE